MKKRIALLCLFLISSAHGILAQSSGADVCFVGLMDYSGKGPEEQDFVLTHRLGTFEPIITRHHRL